MCHTAQEAIRWRRGHQHSAAAVYLEMMVQVMKEFASLPRPARMPLADIVLFYSAQRSTLHSVTKPKPPTK
jgi:hypothetical protein